MPSPTICAGEMWRSQSPFSSSITAGAELTSATKVPDAAFPVPWPKNSSGSSSASKLKSSSTPSVLSSDSIAWSKVKGGAATSSFSTELISTSVYSWRSLPGSRSTDLAISEDSSWAAKPWPSLNATSAGVCRSWFSDAGSAPDRMKRSQTASFPIRAARWSGVSPFGSVAWTRDDPAKSASFSRFPSVIRRISEWSRTRPSGSIDDWVRLPILCDGVSVLFMDDVQFEKHDLLTQKAACRSIGIPSPLFPRVFSHIPPNR